MLAISFNVSRIADGLGEVKNTLSETHSKIEGVKTHLEQIDGKEVDGVTITTANAFAAADEMEGNLMESWVEIGGLVKENQEFMEENQKLVEKVEEANRELKKLEVDFAKALSKITPTKMEEAKRKIEETLSISFFQIKSMQRKLRELKEAIKGITDDNKKRANRSAPTTAPTSIPTSVSTSTPKPTTLPPVPIPVLATDKESEAVIPTTSRLPIENTEEGSNVIFLQ